MHLPLLLLLLAASISNSSGGGPRKMNAAPGDVSRHPSPQGHECMRQISAKIISTLGGFLDGFPGRTALMDVAVHTNVGDNMLWLGAKRLFNTFGRTPDVLCSGAQHDPSQPNFPHCPSAAHLLNKLGTPALIFWHAGGNFGDIYPWVQDARNLYMFELDRELRTNKGFANWNITLVHLPQSIFYKNLTKMADDKELYASFTHLKVHFYTRSQDGVDVMGPGLGVTVKPCPDMVYFLGPQQTIAEPTVDIMLLIRQDQEGAFVYDKVKALAKEMFANTGLTYLIDDWPQDPKLLTNHPQGIWADLAEVRTFFGMKMLGQGKLVVTNRLHSTVLSQLMGIPVIWYSGRQFTGYNKVYETMALARRSSEACTDDNLRTWQAAVPDGGTEEQAVRLAFQQAIDYFKK